MKIYQILYEMISSMFVHGLVVKFILDMKRGGIYLGGGVLYTYICLLVNMDITVVIIPFIIQITSHFLVRIRYILGVAKITNL